jgi:hypothetical protein
MVKFSFEGVSYEGRVVNATYSPVVNTTFCTVDTGAERFYIESHGDLSEGDWRPQVCRPD